MNIDDLLTQLHLDRDDNILIIFIEVNTILCTILMSEKHFPIHGPKS